jgi:uncharacterized protein GlcG (DUF336 family)
MIEMTLKTAEAIAKAAHEEAAELDVSIAVSVVDEAGRLVLCSRADGATFFSPDTSRAKAVAAAAYRVSTKAMAESYPTMPAFWSSLGPVLNGEVLPSTGAVPIVRGGRVIGAVGCGGARDGDQDHRCAKAGAATVAE